MPLLASGIIAEFPLTFICPEAKRRSWKMLPKPFEKNTEAPSAGRNFVAEMSFALPTAKEGRFVLELGRSADFDWTWKGASAFRSLSPMPP